MRTILAAAELLRAKALYRDFSGVADTDADWISKLLQPVHADSFDLVLPDLCRHKFDGLLITNLSIP